MISGPNSTSSTTSNNNETQTTANTDQKPANISDEPNAATNTKTSVKRPPIRASMMPIDLNAELKSRLKISTHASVGNLQKSASSIESTGFGGVLKPSALSKLLGKNASSPSASSSDSEHHSERRCSKDLGKLLRSVSKDNMLGHHPAAATISPGLAASAAASSNVNIALSNISQRLTQAATGPIAPTVASTTDDDTEDDAAKRTSSTSDGDSSGGREVKTIIKNSAVARRKKFNDG